MRVIDPTTPSGGLTRQQFDMPGGARLDIDPATIAKVYHPQTHLPIHPCATFTCQMRITSIFYASMRDCIIRSQLSQLYPPYRITFISITQGFCGFVCLPLQLRARLKCPTTLLGVRGTSWQFNKYNCLQRPGNGSRQVVLPPDSFVTGFDLIDPCGPTQPLRIANITPPLTVTLPFRPPPLAPLQTRVCSRAGEEHNVTCGYALDNGTNIVLSLRCDGRVHAFLPTYEYRAGEILLPNSIKTIEPRVYTYRTNNCRHLSWDVDRRFLAHRVISLPRASPALRVLE